MSSSNSDSARKLFELPDKSILIYAVTCVYRKTVSQSSGKLYIFDNFLCFESSFIGMQTKIVIPIEKITKIEKARSLGVLQNALRIYTDDEMSHFFKRLKDREITYEVMMT